jgi:NAD(P)-dependent dehydrogenase (short-subunit alcohol dehydrogenase family)
MADSFEHIPTPNFSSFTKRWHSEPYPFISPTRPELSAAGKTVLVTGGGTGIGRAVSIAFAQAGAKSIAIIGRRLDRLQDAAAEIVAAGSGRTKVVTATGDVAHRESMNAAVKSISDEVGKIHIFVSCSGALPKIDPVRDYDEAQFRHGLEVNVVGTFNALQAVLPFAYPNAMILNISSLFAHFAPTANSFAYAVNKIAALKMFDYLAAENPDLRVVSVQPGIVATEINSAYDVECPDSGMSSL